MFRQWERRAFIYAMIDPRDGLPFYIGRTYNPAARFQAHDYLTRRPDKAWGSAIAIAQRFQQILAEEVLPVMRLLSRTSLDNGAVSEARMIRKYLKINPNLLNRRLDEKSIKSGRAARKHKDGEESSGITS